MQRSVHVYTTYSLWSSADSAVLPLWPPAVSSALCVSHEFQAADTQEFGTKLHKMFYDTLQHRLLHHCSCDTEQVSIVIILGILGDISCLDVGPLTQGG